MTPLAPERIQTLLADLPGWSWDRDHGSLKQEFRFEDFAQAFGFMAEMAIHSERANHHPEWFNVYNRVEITLTTHDAQGLTQRDFDWASLANQAYARRQAVTAQRRD